MAGMTIELSDKTSAELEVAAAALGLSKLDALRRALSLLDAVAEQKAKNHELAFIEKETKKLVARVVGL